MTAQNSKRSATPASWKPGRSGNPGGRPKQTLEEKQQKFELRKACEALTPEALKTIVDLMVHADRDSVRLAAASFIVERAHGKPVEHKEIRSGPLDDASTETLLEMRKEIEARKQGKPGGEHFVYDPRGGIGADGET